MYYIGPVGRSGRYCMRVGTTSKFYSENSYLCNEGVIIYKQNKILRKENMKNVRLHCRRKLNENGNRLLNTKMI